MTKTTETLQLPQKLLDHASSMLAYWDKDLVCRHASAAYRRWFGGDSRPVVGRHLRDLLGHDEFHAIEPHIAAVLDGRTQVVESGIPGPDGARRPARARYYPDIVDAAVVGFIVEVETFTPADRTGPSCPSPRLAQALASARLGLWQWHLHGDVFLWEDALARSIFGLDDKAGWIDSGAFCAHFLHPDDTDGFRSAMNTFALTGSGFYFQGRYRRSGETAFRWFECFGEMLDGATMVGVVADVSGRVTTSQALLRTIADLTESQTRREELLAIVGHELRNCLAPFSAGLQTLQRELAPGLVAQLGTAMHRQIAHMQRLVDDIDAVGRTQDGDLLLKRSSVSLNAIVQAAGDMARPGMHAADHSFHVHLPAADLIVDGDPVRLTQALANLLDNATKFTPPGGRITVTLRAAADGMASIDVTDSGAGIAPGMRETIFGMYVKAPVSPGVHSNGLGVGLYLARRLVQLHGGTLTAASGGTGLGSMFTIRLPMGHTPGARTDDATSGMPDGRRATSA
jgi:signal transduction histidine kinase